MPTNCGGVLVEVTATHVKEVASLLEKLRGFRFKTSIRSNQQFKELMPLVSTYCGYLASGLLYIHGDNASIVREVVKATQEAHGKRGRRVMTVKISPNLYCMGVSWKWPGHNDHPVAGFDSFEQVRRKNKWTLPGRPALPVSTHEPEPLQPYRLLGFYSTNNLGSIANITTYQNRSRNRAPIGTDLSTRRFSRSVLRTDVRGYVGALAGEVDAPHIIWISGPTTRAYHRHAENIKRIAMLTPKEVGYGCAKVFYVEGTNHNHQHHALVGTGLYFPKGVRE
jgi:hypothetical protein